MSSLRPGGGSTGRASLFASAAAAAAAAPPTGNVGYPEAFYAHTHKTPERSNRQRKQHQQQQHSTTISSSTSTERGHNKNNTAGRDAASVPGSRVVGRLRPQQLNLFVKGSGNGNGIGNSHGTNNTSSSSSRVSSNGDYDASTNSYEQDGNMGNGFSNMHQQQHQLQQLQQLQQQQQAVRMRQAQMPPADICQASVASSSAATGNATTATLAATIPSSHVNIITQAYGTRADIYKDILQIPRDMTSEREIRIAYFRRGRQVLAEKPSATTATKVNSNVSQLAKVRFQAVSMAYEILSNPAWKESYDLYGLHGPDTFQEPSGNASMLAEDASLADRQVLAQNRPGSSPLNAIDITKYNNNTRNMNGVTNHQDTHLPLTNHHHHAVVDSNLYTTPSTVPISSTTTTTSHTPSKSRTKNYVSALPSALPRPCSPTDGTSANGNDNVSCASQSTTGTSASNGVLRKTGSFLEKLNKKKANNTQQQQLPQAPTTMVRWNEEVEELIFRQDPDEISFKAGITNAPLVENIVDHRHTDGQSTKQQQQQPQQQQQNQPPLHSQQQQQQPQEPRHYDAHGSSQPRNTVYEVAANPSPAILPDRAGPPPSTGSFGQRPPQDPYPTSRDPGATVLATADNDSWTRALSNKGRDNAASSGMNGKQRVLLDTSELGSHLEKLDKVADSIADIFDELEASFDGLLGAGNHRTSPPAYIHPAEQQLDDVRVEQPAQGLPFPPTLGVRTNKTLPKDEPQGHVRETQPLTTRILPERQHEEASYQTPPFSFSRGSRFEQRESEEVLTAAEVLAVEQERTRLEQIQIEEQAMALLREISALESIPPADVVVKTKRSKHHLQHQQASTSELALLAMDGNMDNPSQNIAQTRQQRFDGLETYSACASDMAAGGESTTVATTSVVSLLDPEKYSNAPLKPAATTSPTGQRVGRKRLIKNVQRRRHQQLRARENQQSASHSQQQEGDQFFNSSTMLSLDAAPPQDYSMLSTRNRTKTWNQLANPEGTQNPKTPLKKKTEDDYFESLYQNFFALPRERLPTEMTVRTKQHKSSCSVSTLSQSVAANGPESSLKLEFDPWGLSTGAWSNKTGDANWDKERRAKHNRDVMARVDEALAERSVTSGLDVTFDSSFPDDTGVDSTFDSGTFVDTSVDSTAHDTAFTSALDHRKSANIALAALAGCDVPEAFLNTVFNVPLEAPLEFWCGEITDCASAAKPVSRRKRLVKNPKPAKPLIRKATIHDHDGARGPRGETNSSQEESSIEEDDGPPADESFRLRDPPTHDSRIDVCDDSTLNSVLTNQSEATPKILPDNTNSPIQRVERSQRDPSPSGQIPSRGSGQEEEPSETKKPVETRSSSIIVPFEFVKVETASVSQFLQGKASTDEMTAELDESGSDAVRGSRRKIDSEGEAEQEKREGHSSVVEGAVRASTRKMNSGRKQPAPVETDSGSTMEVVADPSSISGKRLEINSDEDVQDWAVDYKLAVDDGMESSATSVSSTVSNERSKSSNLLAYLMSYIKTTADNPSLSCIKTNFKFDMESWRASNEACMDAIVISDEDMTGMLDVIQTELSRHPPDWRHSSE